jgi:hypothetical protein
MNPNPFALLNHFTLPVMRMLTLPCLCAALLAPRVLPAPATQTGNFPNDRS